MSNKGKVRSEDRIIIQKNDVVRRLKGKVLSILHDSQGYPQVSLGQERKVLIHTLVLEAFVLPKPESLCARHLDGNKTNNNLENLMWYTMKNNQADKEKHGTHNSGENHYSKNWQ